MDFRMMGVLVLALAGDIRPQGCVARIASPINPFPNFICSEGYPSVPTFRACFFITFFLSTGLTLPKLWNKGL